MKIETVIPLMVGFLTATIAIIGYFLHRETERIKIVENQVSGNKYKAYNQVVAFFYDILKDIKFEKKSKPNAAEKLIDFKKDLLIYGSDKVFQKYVSWLTYTTTYPGDNKHFKLFLELLIEIRKDMGNKKTKITKKDIMISLSQDLKVYEELKQYIE